jgi:hypothetical protein
MPGKPLFLISANTKSRGHCHVFLSEVDSRRLLLEVFIHKPIGSILLLRSHGFFDNALGKKLPSFLLCQKETAHFSDLLDGLRLIEQSSEILLSRKRLGRAQFGVFPCRSPRTCVSHSQSVARFLEILREFLDLSKLFILASEDENPALPPW